MQTLMGSCLSYLFRQALMFSREVRNNLSSSMLLLFARVKIDRARFRIWHFIIIPVSIEKFIALVTPLLFNFIILVFILTGKIV